MAASQNRGNEPGGQDELSQMKRKLAWRMGVAGLMIVALLGGLMLFDRLTAVRNEPEAPPQFSEPVPVPKKSVTQPLTPVETAPAEAPVEKPAAPETTAAPADKAVPPAPEVAAQPAVPRAAKPAPRAPTAAPTAGRNVEAKTEPLAPAANVPPATPSAAARPQAVLPRLLSGYTLQAGVFADPHRAEDLHARLVQEGIPATLETRVLVGPFRSREEADAARAKMLVMGIEAVQLPKSGKK